MTKTKHRAIAEDLRARIQSGEYSIGCMIPSQTELMTRYAASLATVRHAVGVLAREGWIQPQHGRGNVVQRPRHPVRSALEQSARDISFALVGFDAPRWAYMALLCAAEETARSAHRRVVFASFSRDAADDETFREFAAERRDLIVTGWVDPTRIRRLVPPDQRVVIVGEFGTYKDAEYFGQVTTDSQNAGYLAAQVMTAHGHRRLAVVTREGALYFSKTRTGIEQAARDAGAVLAIRVVHRYPAEMDEVAAELSRCPEITGVIVHSDESACALIQAWRYLGVRVPQDKSVISIGGLPREDLAVPGLTRVNTLLGEQARQAVELLNREPYVVRYVQLSPRVEGGRTVALCSSGAGPPSEN